MTITTKKNDPNVHVEDIQHNTHVLGKSTAYSSVTIRFSVAEYTEFCRFTVPLILK
jgi:hypothetical protein